MRDMEHAHGLKVREMGLELERVREEVKLREMEIKKVWRGSRRAKEAAE